jgi:hypothetical protein
MQIAHVDVVAMSDQWIETSAPSIKTRGNPGTCRSGVDVPRHNRDISNIKVGIIATPARIPHQA